MKPAIIYLHEPREDPSLLGRALEAEGFTLLSRLREVRPEDLSAPLLVSLGGPMGVYEADRYPFLGEELELMRKRLALGRPILGVCLGAQLLAAAAGTRVYPGAHGFRLGVSPIQQTEKASEDPVFGPMPAALEVVHWHGDTFDPVPGAQLLATANPYDQQAFRVGRSYGLQFHPELDASDFGRWVEACPEDVRRAGRTVEEIAREDLPRLEASRAERLALIARLVRACR